MSTSMVFCGLRVLFFACLDVWVFVVGGVVMGGVVVACVVACCVAVWCVLVTLLLVVSVFSVLFWQKHVCRLRVYN